MKTPVLLILLLAGSPLLLFAQEAQHPLDPLTWQEYWTVLEVLRDTGHFNGETRFPMVNLNEPMKDVVSSKELAV